MRVLYKNVCDVAAAVALVLEKWDSDSWNFLVLSENTPGKSWKMIFYWEYAPWQQVKQWVSLLDVNRQMFAVWSSSNLNWQKFVFCLSQPAFCRYCRFWREHCWVYTPQLRSCEASALLTYCTNMLHFVVLCICFCHKLVDSLPSMINSLGLWNLAWKLSFLQLWVYDNYACVIYLFINLLPVLSFARKEVSII